MESYYALTARIRYYGQLPRSVTKESEPAFDAAGKKVLRQVVQGRMDFTRDVSGWIVEEEHGPEFSADEAKPIATSEPMDLSRREDRVHETLANLTLDVDSLCAFTKRWGFLFGNVNAKSGSFRTSPDHIQWLQDLLRSAWRGEGQAIKKMATDISAGVVVTPKGIDIAVVDLWNLTRLLFLRDSAAGRTKICANRDCISLYYLEKRKGQRFCSHECAVLINVRRFRARLGTSKFQPKRRLKAVIHNHGGKQ